MKDIRISIRLSHEEHISFKLLCVKRNLKMQEFLRDFVLKEIAKGKK